jgi:SSS family solute:Na+ symporter
LPYLWLNLLGCALVMGIAIIIQFFIPTKNKDAKNIVTM